MSGAWRRLGSRALRPHVTYAKIRKRFTAEEAKESEVARRSEASVVGTLLDTIEYSPIKIELLSRLGMWRRSGAGHFIYSNIKAAHRPSSFAAVMQPDKDGEGGPGCV
ncbi:hypothetical protein E2C01_055865 [Portunus trituberculatus]|uniref:Uncharacterized protein n=1 Tax=Portunus trituberculatus TaxID=210409 RepID=A0A5B7GW66_PORTR|nr:hypothetical protein [Portunus trituberculatus]